MRKDSIVAVVILLVFVAWAGASYWSDGIIGILLDTTCDATDKVAALQGFFAAWGPFAPVLYVLIVVVEVVVAPIPGTMLYLPGGVIFGGFWGGTLSLTGNVLGAGLCCTLVRTITGRAWSRKFFDAGRLGSLRKFILRHGVISIAILRVNPLTSSDIVSYAAALSPLSARTVMAGTAIGMAPLCFAQAYLSESLFSRFPWLIWPLVVGGILYVGLAVSILWKLRARPAGSERST